MLKAFWLYQVMAAAVAKALGVWDIAAFKALLMALTAAAAFMSMLKAVRESWAGLALMVPAVSILTYYYEARPQAV